MHLIQRRNSRRLEGRAARAPGGATGTIRVLLLSVVLAGTGISLYLGLLRHVPALSPPLRLPWPILALAFAVAEVFVIHFQFRRQAMSFSLMEVPLLVGLFFVSPGEVVLAG